MGGDGEEGQTLRITELSQLADYSQPHSPGTSKQSPHLFSLFMLIIWLFSSRSIAKSSVYLCGDCAVPALTVTLQPAKNSLWWRF